MNLTAVNICKLHGLRAYRLDVLFAPFRSEIYRVDCGRGGDWHYVYETTVIIV